MFRTALLRKITPLLGQSFIFQIIIQLINLTTGFFVVRMLNYKEYACYTIANTFIGMMTVISDGGITSNVMAQGGKVWKDKIALGNIFSTAYDLRKRMALLSLMISLPVLFVLLQKQNISLYYSLLVIICLIPIFFSSLSDNLLQVPLKLHKQIFVIQKNALLVSAVRLLLLVLILFVFPLASIILLITGLTRIYGNTQFRNFTKDLITLNHVIDPDVRKILLKQMYRLLPGTIYYCFSGQIAIWLMSFLGNNTSVASLGAIGRFSLMFSVFTILFGSVITPQFSKINDDQYLLRKQFLSVQLWMLLGGTFIFFIFYLFSDYFLLLLGPSYQQLNKELCWSIAASLLGISAGFSFSLFTARGWSMFPIIPILVNIVSLIAGISFFQIQTLTGVLMMNAFVNLIQYAMNTLFCFYKIQKINHL